MNVFVYVLIPHSFYYSSFIGNVILVMAIPSTVLLLFGIVLDILDIFMFPHEVEDCPLRSVKNYIGILMRIALKMYIVCCRMATFNYSNPTIHEYVRSLHLLISSSISFFSILKF